MNQIQAVCLFFVFCFFDPNLAWNIGTEWRNENTFIALKGDGTVQAWGDVSIPPDLSNVRAIYSTNLAFAAILKDDGSVRAWGSSTYGATSVPQGLVGVRVISSSKQAFAALKEDGTIETWGKLGYEGFPASSMPAGLAGVRAIYSAEYAFAALKWDGTVQAWGLLNDGGTEPANLAGVQAIYSVSHAFTALKQDGTVEGWGNNYGGSGVPSGLAGVRDIFSTESAFAALMESGKVQAWGKADRGGSGVPSDLENVWVIYSTIYAFAALTKEGTVHTWGGEGDGGSGVPQGLTGVREIFSTTHAFAALKRDGSVKVWGRAGYGGTDMPSDLAGVVAISSTKGAFAALMESGKVQAWGNADRGGSGMPGNLTGIRSIYSNSYAFAAITENGTVSAWGVTGKGGSGVPSNLEDVRIIFGTTRYYSDSTAALYYPCPHNTYGPGFPNCTACPQGSNQPIGRPGIRSSIGSCIECGSGKLSFDGTTCQEGCPSGYRLGQYYWYGNSLRCIACLPGEYGNSSECLSCAAGRYSDTQGQSSCQQCPVGKVSSETKTECTKCPPGKVPSLDASECTSCVAGYFREGPDLDCSLCPRGRFSRQAGATECQNCTVGRYADTWGSPVCDYCPGGKYGTTEEAKSSEDGCASCSVGHFSFIGSTKCRPSPPGSYVNITGANDSVPCPAGRYQEQEGQTGCNIAKAGRYASRGSAVSILCSAGTFSRIPAAPSKLSCQACPLGKHSIMNRTSCLSCERGSYSEDSAGSTVCLPCPRGKYLDRAGGNSSLSCLSCPPGTYGDKDRLAECSSCPTGQVQPQGGQISCIDCSLEGKIKTNNAGHTACIDDESLMFLSTSVAEVMFTKGLALGLAFGIAALFMGCAGAIQVMKIQFSATADGDKDGKLGALATPQVMLKSGLPGFSFGSELILIMGMVTEQPELGQTMFAFRLLHPCTIFVLVFTIFVSDSAYVPAFLKKAIRDSSLSRAFSRRKVPPLCLLLLASICDVTMLQMMPWSDCEFYQESAGYPSLNLMLLCMCIKTVQSLVSVICQMTYLYVNTDLNNPLMSYQAKALFGMSIALSVSSLVMGVMTLLAKWALLKDVKENGRRKSATMEMENVYKDDGDNCHDEDVNTIVTSTPSFSGKNPMHSDARDRSKQLGDELEAKNEELLAKDEELRAKDERIRILEAKCRSQLELVL
jgi:alpha-tubulin suppressor-like RCC1 family protein